LNDTTNQDSNQLVELNQWIVDACSRGAVPVLTGMNGDMDTVGSAVSLASSNPNMMACGLHLGRVAKKVCDKLSAPFRKLSNGFNDLPNELGGIIVVDAASPSQIGFEIPNDIPKCVIDHHDTDDWQIGDGDLSINWDVSATTEIITAYLNSYSKESLTNEVRQLLLAGLITDSGRFKHSRRESFSTASTILNDSDIDYPSFVEWLETSEINPSERGSLLRGMQRAKSTESGDWSIIHSYCGILEGRLSGLLLGLGSDISLVSRNREGETRLTARASKKATSNGLSLGHIMQSIASQLGGEGGGHDGAAGWTGKTDRITAESAFIAHVAKVNKKE
tara:strand:+ start:992 stop:1996 length:1005 start_codon:yes stop_codon:yes gene_type:complete